MNTPVRNIGSQRVEFAFGFSKSAWRRLARRLKDEMVKARNIFQDLQRERMQVHFVQFAVFGPFAGYGPNIAVDFVPFPSGNFV